MYLGALPASEERQSLLDMGICSMVNWVYPERELSTDFIVFLGGT